MPKKIAEAPFRMLLFQEMLGKRKRKDEKNRQERKWKWKENVNPQRERSTQNAVPISLLCIVGYDAVILGL